MALNAQQQQMASVIYNIARKRGLNDARARELVAASYAESGLNPSIRNKSSGATGLFQLLSSGYVNTANRLGGVTNPRANTLAIIGDYQRYWQQHPGAAAGAAARDVERSGMGAGFYSAPLRQLTGFRPGNVPVGAGAPTAAPAVPGGAPAAVAAPRDLTPLRQAALQQLLSGNPNDFSGFLGTMQRLRAGQAANAALPSPLAPALGPVASPAPKHQDAAPNTGKIGYLGVPLTGLKPGFVSAVSAAAQAVGVTKIKLTSGYRSPAHNAAVGGVPRSNHMTGTAMDAYGFVPGRGWIPLGVVLQPVARRFGLRSGNQPGFYRGGLDPVHVDTAANVGGVR